MSYTKAFDNWTWHNKSVAQDTPLSAENLQKINDGLDTVDDRVIELDDAMPTKTSDLTNDSNFVTDSEVLHRTGNESATGTKTLYNVIVTNDLGVGNSLEVGDSETPAPIDVYGDVSLHGNTSELKFVGSENTTTITGTGVSQSSSESFDIASEQVFLGDDEYSSTDVRGELNVVGDLTTGGSITDGNGNVLSNKANDSVVVHKTGDAIGTSGILIGEDGKGKVAFTSNGDLYLGATDTVHVEDNLEVDGEADFDSDVRFACDVYANNNVEVSGDVVAESDILLNSESLTEKLSVVATSATGNPVVLTNAAPIDAVGVVMDVEPIQDLHGQDKPWVGGAGKNKLPLVLANIKALNTSGTWSGNVYSIANGTFEILTDNGGNVTGIKVNGTFNATVYFAIANNYALTAGNYRMANNCSASIDAGYHTLQIFDASTTVVCGTNVDKAVELSADTSVTVRLAFVNGANVNNAVFTPILYKSATQDSTFAPYSNICPISGRDEVEISTTDGTDTNTTTLTLPSTLYGGTVDFMSGEVDSRFGLVDFSDLTWTLYSRNRWFATASNVKSIANNTIFSGLTDRFEKYSADGLYSNQNDIGVAINADGEIIVRNGSTTDTPVGQITFELATPTTLTLTPTMLTLLDGTNTVSGDGDMTVEYQKRNIYEAIEEYAEGTYPKITALGTDETGRTTASRAYTAGEFLYKDGTIYKVATAIASGATFTIGTNIVATTLFAELTALA